MGLGRPLTIGYLLRTRNSGRPASSSSMKLRLGTTASSVPTLTEATSAGPSCTGNASIDAGSYDPDGDPLQWSQAPAGPDSTACALVTGGASV